MKRIKVYLDNCCYNRPFDDQTQFVVHLEALAKLKIQQDIRTRKIDLATSYILIAENYANRFEVKRHDIQTFINEYTHTFVSKVRDNDVKKYAKQIMSSGVKLMDACHVASAIIAGSDYFITTDKRLLKYRSTSIVVIDPVRYTLENNSDLEDKDETKYD